MGHFVLFLCNSRCRIFKMINSTLKLARLAILAPRCSQVVLRNGFQTSIVSNIPLRHTVTGRNTMLGRAVRLVGSYGIVAYCMFVVYFVITGFGSYWHFAVFQDRAKGRYDG